MDAKTKKLIMPSLVLVVICLVVSALLAGVNLLTKDIIAEALRRKENAALIEVYPATSDFTKLTDTPELPDAITDVYSTGDGGYVFKAEVSGYASGLVILVGVDAQGKITAAKQVQSSETYGLEPLLNNAYNGVSRDNLTLIIAAGATANSATSKGYYKAMDAALTAFAIMGGALTPEQERNEQGNTLLGTEGLEFSYWLPTEAIPEGVSLYTAEGGYILAVLEEDGATVYSAVNTEGEIVNGADMSADALAKVEEAYNAYLPTTAEGYLTTLTGDELTAAGVTNSSVLSVSRTSTGNYIIDAQGAGYVAQYGGPQIKVRLVIGADGVIISTLTVEQQESENFGAYCAEPEYYEQYNGKNAENYTEVEDIAGATKTSEGYHKAVKTAFNAFEKLTGGNNDD